jgi:hypothetical protein
MEAQNNPYSFLNLRHLYQQTSLGCFSQLFSDGIINLGSLCDKGCKNCKKNTIPHPCWVSGKSLNRCNNKNANIYSPERKDRGQKIGAKIATKIFCHVCYFIIITYSFLGPSFIRFSKTIFRKSYFTIVIIRGAFTDQVYFGTKGELLFYRIRSNSLEQLNTNCNK